MNPSDNQEIPGMDLNSKYSEKKPIIPENTDKLKKDMEKTKKEIEKLKNFIVKKYSFVQAIGILPPQSIKIFIEEEEVPKETEKHIQLYVIVNENKFKEIPKIRGEIIKQIEAMKQKIWLQVKTPIDIWDNSLDSKFELTSAIAMSFPLYDKGILGALRVAEIHKSLVLQKFEKYVVSYVIAGSLVRGEAIKTSDVDVFLIINDTDVKKMSRLELKERLRNIVYQYVGEASALAGVENKLSPQVYLLTDFWESVKDAHPVMFTFIRDGIPIYDRGTFMPWKRLLQMGRLKPSAEALDMYMSMGDNTVKRAKKAMLDIVIQDLFHGVLTPSQGLLMLYGLSPPNVKETVKEMKRIFMDKEKILEKKYIDILEEIVIKYYKGYEHEKIKEVSGKELDRLLKNTESYIKRLKELRKEIEKRSQEKTIDQIYKDVFDLLKAVVGNKSQEKIIQDFEKNLVKKGKFTSQHLRILKDIISARKEFKKGKVNFHKLDSARRDASILINDLIEYTQRCDLVFLDRGKMGIKFIEKDNKKHAEILNANNKTFLFIDNSVKKVGKKIENSSIEEVNEAVNKQKEKKNIEINPKVFEVLKKEFGEFEIVL